MAKSFREWLALHERSLEDIEALRPPKNGKWEDSETYSFDVDGDECSNDMGYDGCYVVSFLPLPDINNKGSGVMVSFTRSGLTSDMRLGVGFKVFDGVRKAISEYVSRSRPKRIVWSPVERTGRAGPANTPDARSKAYDAWAVKAIWPDKYVSYRPNEWVERSWYDRNYAGKGHPPIPEYARAGDRASLARFRAEWKSMLERQAAERRDASGTQGGAQRPTAGRPERPKDDDDLRLLDVIPMDEPA
jgi:hypothetical protein